MNKEVIVIRLGITQYYAACKVAKLISAETSARVVDGTEDDVFFKIRDWIWDSNLSIAQKVSLQCEIYQDMPCYTFVSSLKLKYSKFSPGVRWDCLYWMRGMLASDEPALANPVAYSLWCDFFEDPGTVREVWETMTEKSAPDEVMRKVLIASGPVPYELKLPIYKRLVGDSKWHYYIFRSLLHSQFDVYGSIDKTQARIMLAELELPPDTEHLALLTEKLLI